MDLKKLFLEKNESDLDRAIRTAAGVLLLYLFVQNYATGWMNYIVLLFAVIGLYTGIMGHCLIYSLIGMKTCK